MKKKIFLKKSRYPGGLKALRDFIKTNLRYPKNAIKNRVEGDVFLKFKVNSIGKVFGAQIVNGIGYGCDKEAIRLVNKLQYPKLLNRNIKVTTNKRITIKFRLPKLTDNHNVIINYQITK